MKVIVIGTGRDFDGSLGIRFNCVLTVEDNCFRRVLVALYSPRIGEKS